MTPKEQDIDNFTNPFSEKPEVSVSTVTKFPIECQDAKKEAGSCCTHE
jgi:uncharacterized short protein YbdD (DUF466 family)